MAEATIRSGAPVWCEGWDGRRHAWVESSVGRFACGLIRTDCHAAADAGGARCTDCLELVGIEVSLDLGAERSISSDARAFSDSSERVAACATIVDLVIDDLRELSSDPLLAVAELRQIRGSLHDIAGKLRRAAIRFGPQ